jgi:uncharacterized membrane protein
MLMLLLVLVLVILLLILLLILILVPKLCLGTRTTERERGDRAPRLQKSTHRYRNVSQSVAAPAPGGKSSNGGSR